MKTSLMIDDHVFQEAEKEARKNGKTLSETISDWARIGRNYLKKAKCKRRTFRGVNLGGPAQIDLTSREDWLDRL